MEYLPVYWGMNLVWWFLWIFLLVWIFALPYDIPGSKKPKNNALDILKRRFAAGEISEEEYKKKKELIK